MKNPHFDAVALVTPTLLTPATLCDVIIFLLEFWVFLLTKTVWSADMAVAINRLRMTLGALSQWDQRSRRVMQRNQNS